MDPPVLIRSHGIELTGGAATAAAAATIAVLFAGSTILTPLYVIYKQQFGFSQITLTTIYAVYVVGNLAALLWFGRISDSLGRRRTALPAMAVAIIGALVFLFAQGTVPRMSAGFSAAWVSASARIPGQLASHQSDYA